MVDKGIVVLGLAAGIAGLIFATRTKAKPTPPGIITLTISASAGGTTIPVPGIYEYPVDTYLGIGAYPDDGYEFVEWQEDSSILSTDSELTIFLDGNRKVHAVFQKVVAPLSEFHVPAQMTKERLNGTILGMYWDCRVTCPITNNGKGPGTHTIHVWDSVGNLNRYIDITLQPGETYHWTHSQWINFRHIGTYIIWLEGDWINNNASIATFP